MKTLWHAQSYCFWIIYNSRFTEEYINNSHFPIIVNLSVTRIRSKTKTQLEESCWGEMGR